MESDRTAELLAAACRRFAAPGAQVGLVRGDERIVVCAGVLTVDESAPVRPSTAFHAGSLAKPLVASLVLAAERRGEVDLDVPCSDQAPGLWDDTPRALMAQTTGRANVLPDLDEDVAAFVARVGALPRVHEPGRFSYCNAGWPVLDLLLRHRSGGTFESLAREALGPSTTFGMPEGAAPGHAAGPGTPPVLVPAEYADAASAAGSRWWATADQLLDFAVLHLPGAAGPFDPGDVLAMRSPEVRVPGTTISDSWGLGWALWDRGDHRAFGWAGFTGGHRAYLRAFPEQDAALVVLANSAGPLFGPPGGSALFDALLPDLLDLLEVPPLPAAPAGAETPVTALAGRYGPLQVDTLDDDRLLLRAAAFGAPEPLPVVRHGGDTFVVEGDPPGAVPVAFDGDLLYVGPFAVPRG